MSPKQRLEGTLGKGFKKSIVFSAKAVCAKIRAVDLNINMIAP